MQNSNIPTKMPVVWGTSAGGSYIRTVSIPSQIGVNNGYASFTDGFVPLNFVNPNAGGIPPFGQDINGALNAITAWNQWQQAGAWVYYDSVFSTAIGGYPKYASLIAVNITNAFWVSQVDNNTSDPDTGGANWLLCYFPNALFFVQVIPQTNFYVNASTGSDSLYDGTSATVSGSHGPWATITHAVVQISTYFSASQVTINVAGGTYNGFTINQSDISSWNVACAGSSSVTILASTSATNGGVAALFENSNVTLSGATLRGSVGCIGWGGSGASGYCFNCVIDGSLSPSVGMGYSGGASGTIQGANTFTSGTGTFSSCVSAQNSASIAWGLTTNHAVITLLGTIVNAATFVSVAAGASISCVPSAMSFLDSGGSGTSGATRFSVSGAGGVYSNGGTTNLFPGGIAGVITSPGYYY
jgi:hypothetical protein